MIYSVWLVIEVVFKKKTTLGCFFMRIFNHSREYRKRMKQTCSPWFDVRISFSAYHIGFCRIVCAYTPLHSHMKCNFFKRFYEYEFHYFMDAKNVLSFFNNIIEYFYFSIALTTMCMHRSWKLWIHRVHILQFQWYISLSSVCILSWQRVIFIALFLFNQTQSFRVHSSLSCNAILFSNFFANPTVWKNSINNDIIFEYFLLVYM